MGTGTCLMIFFYPIGNSSKRDSKFRGYCSYGVSFLVEKDSFLFFFICMMFLGRIYDKPSITALAQIGLFVIYFSVLYTLRGAAIWTTNHNKLPNNNLRIKTPYS